MDRFDFPQCVENRTWQQLASTYSPDAIITGGLGLISSEAFRVWVCFASHPCLSFVPHDQDDMMCYVFNEVEQSWYPWCLNSERKPSVICDELKSSIPAPRPIWSSTQQGRQDTGYIPSAEHPSHTLIVALRFPASHELLPGTEQWILNYGHWGFLSQHWIWYGYEQLDATSFTFQNPRLGIGEFQGQAISEVNMGQPGQHRYEIQGGKVMTICTVSHPDEEYTLYLNGSRAKRYKLWRYTKTHGDGGLVWYEREKVYMRFSYKSSNIQIGHGYDESWAGSFKGIIHETRLYNFSLTAAQVQSVTDELCDLYS